MRRNGFTLVETLILVVIMGIVLAFGIPKFRETQMRSEVRGAHNAVVNWYSRARTAAVSSGRTVTMNISGNRILVTRSTGVTTFDTVGVERLDNMFHVTATSSVADVVVTPTGLGSGGADDTQIIVSRDGIADTVMISRFGRVLK
jgi:Tfp pilus assembly protein FimT